MWASRFDRLVTLGTSLCVGGSAADLAYYIYVHQAPHRPSFWMWITWTATACLAFGVMITTLGLVGPSSERAGHTQSQTGGDQSTNLQAGRDIRLQGGTDE